MMNKDEFKQSVDNIKPDCYMPQRLKAKVLSAKPKSKRKRLVAPIASALCLALLITGIGGFKVANNSNQDLVNTQSTRQSIASAIIDGNVMVAYASEKGTTSEALQLDVETPIKYQIFVTDIRSKTSDEIDSIMASQQKLNQEATVDNVSDDTDSTKGGIELFDNVIIRRAVYNSFALSIDEPSDVESINVKSSSEYGYVDFALYSPNISLENSFPRGNDITIDGETYADIMELAKTNDGCFEINWHQSEEMEQAINNNPNIPLSTFGDVLTFTVEYKNGDKAVSNVEIKFDDNGNMTAKCTDYNYSAK